ncbi:glycosyltransferase [Limosilactobacillus reuteri]|uniref:glycosyltransferase n=1 Tax=Limosilactobacillus reuteri TaxID=1598 RepID=UPI0023600444|nr:glycosyltransferase [Limosilactobacillus reuteri]MDD1380272.1 glycosyltransferase [Limosilactobacillus reuteri]
MHKEQTVKNIIVYALTDRRGGIESFFINYLKVLKNIHLDFIKLTPEKLTYKNNLANSKIYYIPRRRNNPKVRKRKIKEILQSKKYDALWFNSNDLASVDIIREAKKAGIKCIGHAHNSRTDKLNRTIRHNINKKLINRYFDEKFACSKSAARWFYPDYEDATIIYNAINVENYLFDKEKRNIIRKKYNISNDSIVLGDIGRLEKQKNISYLIDIFEQYHNENPKSYLMIVGNGSLREELKKYAVSKQLDQYIIFTGEIDNPNDYLSAFDMFIMPSLYEGLPVTLVEAQAAGLKCIVANNITREVNITGNIEYLSINKDSISLWANHVVKSNDRVNNGKKLIGSFFDISKSADYLEKKILEVIN